VRTSTPSRTHACTRSISGRLQLGWGPQRFSTDPGVCREPVMQLSTPDTLMDAKADNRSFYNQATHTQVGGNSSHTCMHTYMRACAGGARASQGLCVCACPCTTS
jgi:hypothetical protein